MADKSVRGKFVWHDLVTSDPAAAQTFYTKVLGWKTQAWEQDPNYTMFAAASGPLGGSVAGSDQPHWVAYIATDNLGDTLAKATGLGASIVKDTTSTGSGEYAILKDPQGAVFGIYASESGSNTKDAAPKRGEFSWHELATTDPEAAVKFYDELFGWGSAGAHDMGPGGLYHMFGPKDRPMGGIYKPQSGMSPNWLGYVRVKDVNQIVKKVKSAGGKVVNGPMEVPGGDWIVQFTDPQGAALAAHTLAADLQGAKEAASAGTQSVPTAEVEEVSSPIEGASEPAPKKKRAAGKSAAKSSGKAKSSKAKKKAQPAKKAAKKGSKKAAKKSRKGGAKKRAAAKNARGARKSAKRAVGKKSAKKTSRTSGKKAAKKKSRSARKGK